MRTRGQNLVANAFTNRRTSSGDNARCRGGGRVAACLGSPYASDRRVYSRDEAREWRPRSRRHLQGFHHLLYSYLSRLFPSHLYTVLEFRNEASSLAGLRARLPLENRDATFLLAIFLLSVSLLPLLLCQRKKKRKVRKEIRCFLFLEISLEKLRYSRYSF